LKLRDTFLMALGYFRSGRTGSFLCALAVCVGVTSVCAVSGLGSGAAEMISDEVAGIGIGGIAIYANTPGSYYIAPEQAEIVAASVDGVASAMPMILRTGTIKIKSTSSSAAFIGIDENLADIFSIEVVDGRLPSVSECASGGRVIVIDDELAAKMYGNMAPIGKKVRVGFGAVNAEFTVIGVIRSQKSGLEGLIGSKLPVIAYMPHSAISDVCGKNLVDKIVLSCDEGADQEAVAAMAVRKLRHINSVGFSYENINAYMSSVENITSVVSLLVSAVAAISVVVGGLGVMNSMASSAENRVSDIGVMISLGARKRDIVFCFMWEALLICFCGGLSGTLLCGITFRILSGVLPFSGFSWNAFLLGVGCSVLCGILAGILPALKASRMDPIAAIRGGHY